MQNRQRFLASGLITGLLILLAYGCGRAPTVQLPTFNSGAGENIGNSSGLSGTASVSAGLYINVSSQWDGATETDQQILCQVPLGSPSGTVVDCPLSMPEGQLHFSALTFKIGSADPTTCPQVNFEPYYYQASTSPTYQPPIGGSAVVNCGPPIAGQSLPVSCFDGPALTMVPSFPTYTAIYFLTIDGVETSYSIPSANSKFEFYNTYAASAITAPAAPDSITADGYTPATYLANTMHGYRLTCRDAYFEKIYSITLEITSVPFVGAGVISFPGWD